ncbi:MAG TPA: histone deacetylase [Gemmataceae bacterium]|nr:histone deacetylase [Gemmataceae bacterium]
MTFLVHDPLFQRHDTGRHPENAGRLRAIGARLEVAGLLAKCQRGDFQPLRAETVARVHAPEVVQRAEEVAESGGGHLDADTVVSPESYRVALRAAGACVAAVDAVLRGTAPNALCLVRPPGHHATPQRSMGFCLFNNIALAARHACNAHSLTRILIVDWDVHHGNGTQDIFYEDPQVFFFSIHRYGHGFYPGTGARDETGLGKGLGSTFNEPIRYGTPVKEFHGRFLRGLERAADKVKPELVLISAGFDAHRADPIGSLGLETEDFAILTQHVLDVARTHSAGRLVSCLEGGYDPDALAESVQAHLSELLKESRIEDRG